MPAPLTSSSNRRCWRSTPPTGVAPARRSRADCRRLPLRSVLMSEMQRVRTWAEALIALHLDATWSFGFDNAKRRAGLCDYTRRRISVSRYLTARYDDDPNHQTGKPPGRESVD